MLIVLRFIGVFNAAIWLGAAVFFTFGVAPGVFSAEMKRIFGDEYTGFIGQQLISRYFALHLICGLIALGHFFAEMIYAGKSFRRFTFTLLAVILALGLLGGYFFTPRIKALAHLKYRGTPDQRPAAAQQLKRLHAFSASGNLLSLIALVLYTWQITHPSEPTRFVGTSKFRD